MGIKRWSSLFLPSLTPSSLDLHFLHRKPVSDEPNKTPNRINSLPDLPPPGLGISLDMPQFSNKDGSDRSTKADSGAQGTGRLQKPPPPRHSPPPVPTKASTLPPSSTFDFDFADTKPSPRLRKEQKRRSSSVTTKPQTDTQTPSNQKLQKSSPPLESRIRSTSANPATARSTLDPENHASSTGTGTPALRPGSSNGSRSPPRESEPRGRPRRSWLPGARSRSQSTDSRRQKVADAWVLGQGSDYNTAFLANGERVPELWNESGDVLVYLDAKGSGGSPSFKVPAFTINNSLVFADLIEAEMTSPSSTGRERARSFTGRDNLSVLDATRRVQSPPLAPPAYEHLGDADTRLYLPVSMSSPGQRCEADMERLVSIRNMFAFLTGQPLVATKAQPNLFSVFLNISNLLKEFEFTNSDGSTYGEAVEASFSFFMEQMALADVRHSREKTLESLILGERMRSMELYSEAFAHAVGKYPAMRDLRSPLWEHLSPSSRQRLERAHLELVSRQNGVNNRLEAFEFPALFSGTANSTSSSQYKDVKFNSWRKSFGRMRQFVIGYYKNSFGSWPPKARSKKNPFTESGLNRQVLKILYSDFCALYDLLVDRESLTTRVIDQSAEDVANDYQNARGSAMRKILTEFDQSSPPVLPPIPFDLPKLPDMASVQENFHDLPPKEQAKLDRGLQEYQVILILNKAYDFDTVSLRIPFLEQFKEFELKEAKGKTAAEMADHRLGYWLFLYVIIQSLPMLVVDAPGLKYTEGVEYFLCQPVKGSPPWIEDAPAVRKRWYEVAGGGGLVELSEDAVQFGIEGVYHRSHCWLAAKRWEHGDLSGPPPPLDEGLSPLGAPQPVFQDMDPAVSSSPHLMPRSESPLNGPPGHAIRSRGTSPAGGYRSSIALGLEPVSLPTDGHSRSASRVSTRGSIGGSRPVSAAINRSRSSGNLQALAGPPPYGTPSEIPNGSRSSSRQDSAGASTFDDILKDMGGDKTKQTKKKKGLF
ncbi:hypothetical protein GGS20DRAFT_547656 [Poronia punctata]|nr:hypothetical protein GGS20DRAFT_547656 [Poronia punctata]